MHDLSADGINRSRVRAGLLAAPFILRRTWARVFNDDPYDRIRGYTNVNLALILTDTSGWQVMGYVKNIFDTTAITGDFLNSDDSGLTTNIFLTDPRLFGVRVTKHFDGGDSGGDIFAGLAGKRPTIWITVGGSFSQLQDDWQQYNPPFASIMPDGLPNPVSAEKAPSGSFDWEGNVSIQPEDSDWVFKAGVRYGRSSRNKHIHKSLPAATANYVTVPAIFQYFFHLPPVASCAALEAAIHGDAACPFVAVDHEFVDAQATESELHAMMDFTLGKDVGLGTIGAGVRIAQFTTEASAELNADPHYNFPKTLHTFTDPNEEYGELYNGVTKEKRGFHGSGPEVKWDAQRELLGDEHNGEIDIDWGMNVGVLFGRQTVTLNETLQKERCHGRTLGTCASVVPSSSPQPNSRSKRVAVPNLGGYVGASVRYSNAKINFGYRVDEYFGAMDGGQDSAKRYNRGFYGPYLNVSLGLGG